MKKEAVDTKKNRKKESIDQKKKDQMIDSGLKEKIIQNNHITSSETSFSTISTGGDKSEGRMKVIIRLIRSFLINILAGFAH